jgi:hypothetical protein
MASSHNCLRAAALMLGCGTVQAMLGCASPPVSAPLPIVTTEQPCPSWVAYPTDHHSNADSPSLGCVSALNLRAMVEHPADLERGRPLGPASGERESRAVEAYDQGKVQPLAGSGAMTPQMVMPVISTGGGTP